MDKLAQRRGILNELREKINTPKSYLDTFFKPELERVMSELKKIDDQVRSLLTGQQMGEAEAPANETSAKDLLKKARSNFNRKEYMSAAADLGKFHRKMYEVTKLLNSFKIDVNRIHNRFLFEGVNDERINELRQHMQSVKADIIVNYFIKQAGIMDFFYNIATKRGRALAAWEKKYPKETKELRAKGDLLINEGQRLLDNAIVYLKQMATARAVRRPDDYVDIANKLIAESSRFDKGFQDYYNGPISHWLSIKDQIEAEENAKKVTTEKPIISNTIPTNSPSVKSSPANVPPGIEMSPPSAVINNQEDEEPETQRAPVPVHEDNEPIPLNQSKKAHQDFYHHLLNISEESPQILRKYISKYAFSIKERDPETAIKLFKIVKQIKD